MMSRFLTYAWQKLQRLENRLEIQIREILLNTHFRVNQHIRASLQRLGQVTARILSQVTLRKASFGNSQDHLPRPSVGIRVLLVGAGLSTALVACAPREREQTPANNSLPGVGSNSPMENIDDATGLWTVARAKSSGIASSDYVGPNVESAAQAPRVAGRMESQQERAQDGAWVKKWFGAPAVISPDRFVFVRITRDRLQYFAFEQGQVRILEDRRIVGFDKGTLRLANAADTQNANPRSGQAGVGLVRPAAGAATGTGAGTAATAPSQSASSNSGAQTAGSATASTRDGEARNTPSTAGSTIGIEVVGGSQEASDDDTQSTGTGVSGTLQKGMRPSRIVLKEREGEVTLSRVRNNNMRGTLQSGIARFEESQTRASARPAGNAPVAGQPAAGSPSAGTPATGTPPQGGGQASGSGQGGASPAAGSSGTGTVGTGTAGTPAQGGTAGSSPASAAMQTSQVAGQARLTTCRDAARVLLRMSAGQVASSPWASMQIQLKNEQGQDAPPVRFNQARFYYSLEELDSLIHFSFEPSATQVSESNWLAFEILNETTENCQFGLSEEGPSAAKAQGIEAAKLRIAPVGTRIEIDFARSMISQAARSSELRLPMRQRVGGTAVRQGFLVLSTTAAPAGSGATAGAAAAASSGAAAASSPTASAPAAASSGASAGDGSENH